jgi:galactokinase/mevalonate kinase-like predicted kinase
LVRRPLSRSASFRPECAPQRFLPAGRVAEEACHIEIDVLKEPIGKQDQYASAFGGLNQFVFHSDGRTTVQRIFLAADTVQRLEASLFLFYLGGSRSASSILKEQTSNLDQTKIFETQKAMVCQVDVGIKLLQDGDLDGFGRLLHEAWLVKKTLASKISSDVIDAYYQKGLEAGVGWEIRRRGRRRLSSVLLSATSSAILSGRDERTPADSPLSRVQRLPGDSRF